MSSERPLESRTGGRAATTGVIPGEFAISVGNPRSPLPDGWKWTLLTDVARLETGHTPSRKHPEYWGGDVPWIGIRDATGNHGQTIYRTAQYTNELGIRNSSARILPAQTVCLSRTASVGYVVVMGAPMATSQDFVNWVCGPALDHRYLKYILLGERNSFLRFASGTTHQTIYFPEVKAFHAALPPIEVQRDVADVLGAIDDRITLLRETNATLEAIAQALFKSWFVDFDPVRAKQAGRAPEGMSDATAALFPDSFEESELGLVPKGWRVGTFADLIRLHKGSVNPGAQPDVTFQHFSLPAFDAGQMPLQELGRAIKSNKTTVPQDAVLLSKLNPHIPRIWLPSVVKKEAICSTEFLPFIPNGPATTAFVYCLLAAPNFSSSLCQLVTGTSNSHQRIKPDGVLSLPTTIPSAEIVSEFDAVASPLFARLRANRKQAQTLATLRDTLLPRLISGQLRLPEAEALIAELA